jgi:hypothetical protein
VESLRNAVLLDPGFAEARRMLAFALARNGDCAEASRELDSARAASGLPRRTYPHGAGTGELHDAAITRRRSIANIPALDEVASSVASCAAGEHTERMGVRAAAGS